MLYVIAAITLVIGVMNVERNVFSHMEVPILSLSVKVQGIATMVSMEEVIECMRDKGMHGTK